jgi:hypothetical protein
MHKVDLTMKGAMKDEDGVAIGGGEGCEEEGWYDLKYCQGKGMTVCPTCWRIFLIQILQRRVESLGREGVEFNAKNCVSADVCKALCQECHQLSPPVVLCRCLLRFMRSASWIDPLFTDAQFVKLRE